MRQNSFAPSISLLVIVLAEAYHVSGLSRLPPWTRDINRRLCEPDGHPSLVVYRYFECFQQYNTPGGSKFVECQKEIYGVRMYTARNIEKVCTQGGKLPLYVTCIMSKLIASGNRVSVSVDKLNECQGPAVVVPNPNPRQRQG